MTTYVGLLRGINVGGHRRVSMAELRSILEARGIERVQTLLQSGNVVFRSDDGSPSELERRLESVAAKHLDLEIAFFVRTAAQWKTIVARNPFPREAKRDPSHLLVTLLKAKPKPGAVRSLEAAIVGPEAARVSGREAYIVYPDGVGRSKLTSAVIEKSLGTSATARNWNTVVKLAALTSAD